jgi:hypothetical protein
MDIPEYASASESETGKRGSRRYAKPREMPSLAEMVDLRQQQLLQEQQQMAEKTKKGGFTKKWAALITIVVLLLLDTSILSTNLLYSINGNARGSMQSDSGGDELVDCQPIWPRGPLRRVVVCKFAENDPLANLRQRQFVVDAKRPRYDGLLSSLIRYRRHGSNATECEIDENLIRVLDVVLNGSGCLLTEGQFKDLVQQRPWIELGLFVRKATEEDNDGSEQRSTAQVPVPPTQAAEGTGATEKEPGAAESAGGQEPTQ